MSTSRCRWRVGCVEDHEITALGLRLVVDDAPDLQWMGAHLTVEGLLATHRDLDVVVLDLSLPDFSTPEGNVARLTAEGVRTLVYTAGERPDLLRSAARAGVPGTIKKTAPAAVVQDAIRTVALGGEVLSTQWAAALDADPNLRMAKLSVRQQEVLTLVGSGMSEKMVASRMGIECSVVKTYISRIRLKYADIGRSAPTQAMLGRRAVEDGYVSPDYGPRSLGG